LNKIKIYSYISFVSLIISLIPQIQGLFVVPQVFAATQVSSVSTEKGGWATFGVVFPQRAVTTPLQVGSLPTQTDVKVKWPDGSTRQAILTTKVPSAGTYPINTIASQTGTPPAITPMCTAEITIAGVKYVATPSGAPQSLWLSGSQVTEGRWLVPFGNHPARKLRLDQRTFSDGAVKCDFSIENALNVSQTKPETYDVVLKYNGSPIYTRTNVVQGSFARWRYVYWDAGTDANATADLTTFIAAKAIPNYQTSIITNDNLSVPAVPASGTAWQIPPSGYDANGNKLTSWDILNLGPMHYPMWDYGGREDIGPYPEWVAQFVTFRNSNTRAYMLKIADLAGSWANHITEVDDSIPSVEQKPNFWLLRSATTDGANGPANNKAGIRPEYDDNYLDGAWRPELGNAHQPSFSYVPYLVTGDRYYSDEMRFWASDAVITWNPSLDGKPLSINDDEIRGTSWGMRDIVDATTYLPDGDPNKVYFRKVVDATLSDIQTDAQVPDVTGLGAIMLGRSAPNVYSAAPTTQLFMAWSLSHAADQGISNATGAALDRLTRPLIILLTHPQEYPIKYIPNISDGF
jgi:hypothetical protein